jgi:hypothetical protein
MNKAKRFGTEKVKVEQPRFDFDRDVAKFTERQMEAVRHLDRGYENPPRSPVKFLLYGGALGGG